MRVREYRLTEPRPAPIIAGMPERNVNDLPSVTQAMAIIDAAEARPRVVRMPLMDAQGLHLAEDVAADRDSPPFDKSQMDGYAVRCVDAARVPVELRVIGEIAAGTTAPRELSAGEAYAIMTGAPMPPAADGVVPVEETKLIEAAGEGDSPRVRLSRAAIPGKYIAPRGSDAKEGAVVLKKGMRLEAAQLAVAASVGRAELLVFARPRVAVLSTGDELVPVDQTPGPSQIRNSNNAMLVGLLRKLGCDVTDLGTASDQPEIIRAAIESGGDCDVVFVTGGMSMGTHDFVPQVIRDLGYELRITKLRIKPGKPFVFAAKARTEGDSLPSPMFLFGLPGNPVSGFVCTFRLASRLTARLAGGPVREKWLTGTLDAGLPANGPREFYQPALWTPPSKGGTSARSEFPTVTPLGWKGSADLFTLAAANAMIVRAENEGPLPKGVLVRVLEL